jgi:methyl-accepting chemotaxis protein
MISLSMLSVRARLVALIVVPVLGLGTFGVMSKVSTDRVRIGGPLFSEIVANKDLIADTVPPPASVLEAYLRCHEMPDAPDGPSREALIADFARVEADYQKSRERWMRELEAGELRTAMVDQAIASGDKFFSLVDDTYIPLVRAGKFEEAGEFLDSTLSVVFRDQQAAISRVVKIAAEQSAEIEQRATASISTAQWLIVGLGLGLIGTTAALGWWIAGGIVRPITRIRDFMQELAEGGGNLQTRVDVGDDRSEVGQLARSFNAFLRLINSLLIEIKTVSDEVCSSSHRIAAASEETSRSMTLQSDSMRDISALVDQIAESSGSVAERTNQALSAAKSTGEVANQGAIVVQKTIDSMRSIDSGVTSGAESVSRLGARSKEIGQIIGVINDIADQTNLLALNAAIEAARAGEHGRGFAVVADEVRKLADRTTQATKQVAESIQQIQEETRTAVDRMGDGTKEVRSGVELAGTASTGLRQIVEKAEHTSRVTSEIAAAASEQAQMGLKMRQHIEGLSATSAEVVQATASSTEAIFQLTEKTKTLAEAVKRFKIDGRRNDRRPPPTFIKTPRGTIIDVSAEGVHIELNGPFSGRVGQSVTAELEIAGVPHMVPSEVAWLRGNRLGLHFKKALHQLEAAQTISV